MNKLTMTVLALALASLTPALADEPARVELAPVEGAAAQAAVQRGKELFNSTKLGGKPISCATCHPDGRGLQWAAAYDDKRLTRIVNQCIRAMLEGKPLPPESGDMAALVSYLRTFEPVSPSQ